VQQPLKCSSSVASVVAAMHLKKKALRARKKGEKCVHNSVKMETNLLSGQRKNKSTTSWWPLLAAQNRGVLPFESSSASEEEPRASSSATTLT